MATRTLRRSPPRIEALEGTNTPGNNGPSRQPPVQDVREPNPPVTIDALPIDDQGNSVRSVAPDGKHLTVDGPEAQTLGARRAAQLQQRLNRDGVRVTITYKGSRGVVLEGADAAALAAGVERLPEALGTVPNAEALEHLGRRLRAVDRAGASRPAEDATPPGTGWQGPAATEPRARAEPAPREAVAPAKVRGLRIDGQGDYIRSITPDGQQVSVDGPDAQALGVKGAAQLQHRLNREGRNVTITYKGSDGLRLESPSPRDLAAALKHLPEALGTDADAEGLEHLEHQLSAAVDNP
jgi:hypothetical protein